YPSEYVDRPCSNWNPPDFRHGSKRLIRSTGSSRNRISGTADFIFVDGHADSKNLTEASITDLWFP
ncbi:MAG: hypothetical protein PHV82_10795, partial [Victivallaceae bacterium]|nr:hypothetical protein [Victivallaceae bacterium]